MTETFRLTAGWKRGIRADDSIIGVLRLACGRSVCLDTLVLMTGLRKDVICQRLTKLRHYGVRKTTERRTSFWRLE